MTQATLDNPVKGPTFHPISASRKIKNRLAETLFAAAFLIALVPLVWLLYTVTSRGISAVLSYDWWNKSLSGVLPDQMAGGVYHAIYGTIIQAAIAASRSAP